MEKLTDDISNISLTALSTEDSEDSDKLNNIVEQCYNELNNIMDNWCKNHEENYNGGKMRGDRENILKNL